MFEAAAICTPGLEEICEQELRALKLKPRVIAAGVIQFKASPRQLYSANVWLRTATRVVVRIAKFRATDFPHLEERAKEVAWADWLPKGFAPEFRVTAKASKLYHTDAVAQRLHLVVGPPGMPEREGEPAQRVQRFIVRIHEDIVTVSADSSGEGLQRRAWRQEIGVAPIRPTMAAAMLLGAGWNGETGLVDPFCGSGTIPIEAALIARNLPPGGDREFAFQHWPGFEVGTWASVLGSIKAASTNSADGPSTAKIEASDRDPTAVAAARANAERAGVGADVEISQMVVSHLKGHDGSGLVATNPPYGKRVGDGELEPLYRKFGSIVRERFPLWDLAVIAPDARLVSKIDRGLKSTASFGHGGVRVKVFMKEAQAQPDDSQPSPEVQAEDQPSES